MVTQRSVDPYALIYQRAEEAVLCGRLPRKQTARVLGGRGNGSACTLCGEPIGPGEAQIHLQKGLDPSGPDVRLHFDCYRLWELVRQRIAERDLAYPRGDQN